MPRSDTALAKRQLNAPLGRGLLFAAVLACALACGGEDSAISSDGGELASDAGPDSGASVDAGTDGGASADAGIDGGESVDAGTDGGESADAGIDGGESVDAGTDGGESDAGTTVACAWGGAPGECILVSSCSALGDHSSYADLCPGPADIQCCIVTPNPANNPPVPEGYELMKQSQVTQDMTNWAVAILDDPTGYPMFATTTMEFGSLLVLARVEWHPPDFQNSVVHRGVTLYVPV